MVLLEEDREVVEYRRIIELEWCTTKPKGWGGLRNSWKQWLVVTDLIPEKHQTMIDEADDIKDTYESYFINWELYNMILSAPNELQPCEIDELTFDD
jgi:hypothetical protein